MKGKEKLTALKWDAGERVRSVCSSVGGVRSAWAGPCCVGEG